MACFPRSFPCVTLLCLLLPVMALSRPQDPAPRQPSLGYQDTPLLPDSRWRVHDGTRPQPVLVTPAPADQPYAPPSDAVVLFDGSNLDQWTGRGDKAAWKLVDGAMEVNRTGDIQTRQSFGDCQLHLEYMAPAEPVGTSQGRANSGVFFFGRYEVQILDSFDNKTYPDGQAAALYGQTPPLVNASRPPGQWQSLDIIFEAPRFEQGKLLTPAHVTVLHNGVLVHHRRVMLGATAHRAVARYSPHGPKGPIRLQDHGDPVRFRNVWVRELRGYDGE